LIFLYCVVEVHSQDDVTAYCDFPIVPLAACFNDELYFFLLCPYGSYILLFVIFYILHYFNKLTVLWASTKPQCLTIEYSRAGCKRSI